MGKTIRLNSGSEWEQKFGYSRAVRVGNQIFISGTLAVDEKGEVVTPDNPYQQTRFILKKLSNTLEKLGASIKHVVRTRIYVCKIADYKDVGKAHNEFFRECRPASTLVEVTGFVKPECLVEIEVDAFIPNFENRKRLNNEKV